MSVLPCKSEIRNRARRRPMSNCGGIIICGDRLAYINHDVLIPQLAQLFPEIAACRPFGTINLELDEPLQKHCADFWTRQIMWRPLVPLPRIPRFEAFGFTRIKVAGPLSDKIHDGWIMLPEGARSSYNDRQAEVIVGVLVPGVEYGRRCAIQLEHIPLVVRPKWFGESFGIG